MSNVWILFWIMAYWQSSSHQSGETMTSCIFQLWYPAVLFNAILQFLVPSLKNKDILYKFQMSMKMTSIWQVRFIIIKQVYNTLLNQFLLCCTFRRFTKTQLPDCQLYRLIFYHDFTVGPKFLLRMQSIDCCL